MNIGLIVEGFDDYETYPVLVRKSRRDIGRIHIRECGGLRKLKTKFVYFLKEFQSNPAYQIKKAIVIRDSDCSDAHRLEQELHEILQQSGFEPTFSVHFHATRCKLESLLLADEEAIPLVARNRDKVARVSTDVITLESLKAADDVLSKRLFEANLPADAKVFAEIAEVSDLDKIVSRCPHFQDFMEKTNAC
jgi:hypothetical protein